ncbi:uncharacterized protein RHIMIDRAFT_233057 [Rhizopus microsporus ATCC 52813]|uniref:Uncharacterized protein n=1 Tax=Rhizopus microsporus ATCC 52813 TaxID=1340429 RepID=A0A2G4T9E5_RHIZD|nr:uncharacterized protein RHIMIDRAFT_233057 [Rhizopus microsporus ATCC 52813]PHZ17632.1 hypothetical protein RHIMIDRAFT_233057 [Rhizopus microsporus ATCC 52813]
MASNDAKRLLKALIVAVTAFFGSAIDHQNKDQAPIKIIRSSNTKQPAKTRSSRRTVGPDSRKHQQQSVTAVISDN